MMCDLRHVYGVLHVADHWHEGAKRGSAFGIKTEMAQCQPVTI